ncbi:NAD(P)H-hydrate dehydratase [Schlesneria paludicola]|uniref:NAD(P)H-hydrate dehydratase n=1 Tax=Schlesneria paludicola TaxID=360056 RepID=UPI00029ABB42|nr:NAD(P)H-hydrate dehydratase [Schlesneria paludicola]
MAEIPKIQLVSSLPQAPKRADDAHKGDCGRALIFAGSRGMSGAACLSGTAALRGGAGLVTVAVPVGIVPIVASYEPSYLTLGLPEDIHGRTHQSAHEPLLAALAQKSAAAVGPGLGQSAGLQELVTSLYESIPVPCVFDADGLNLLAKRPYLLRRAPDAPARILTPHVGEFSRLTGEDANSIQDHRTQFAAAFAKTHNVILVLKGQNTVVTDGTRVAINTTGNSGMATGGTGDVLTGLLTALLAQGLPAFEAAHLGVYLHGLAGDLAAVEMSKQGLIASDLLRFLGRAWCDLIQ